MVSNGKVFCHSYILEIEDMPPILQLRIKTEGKKPEDGNISKQNRMHCRKLGTEVLCGDPKSNSQSAGADIASGIGDTIWGIIQAPNHLLKRITGIDAYLGQDRAWSFSNLGRAYSWSLRGNPLFIVADTANHIFYGGLNTLTAGYTHIIFNQWLGLNIQYFSPPPKTIRESARVVSGGIMIALPLKGVVLNKMGIKAPPPLEVVSEPAQLPKTDSAITFATEPLTARLNFSKTARINPIQPKTPFDIYDGYQKPSPGIWNSHPQLKVGPGDVPLLPRIVETSLGKVELPDGSMMMVEGSTGNVGGSGPIGASGALGISNSGSGGLTLVMAPTQVGTAAVNRTSAASQVVVEGSSSIVPSLKVQRIQGNPSQLPMTLPSAYQGDMVERKSPDEFIVVPGTENPIPMFDPLTPEEQRGSIGDTPVSDDFYYSMSEDGVPSQKKKKVKKSSNKLNREEVGPKDQANRYLNPSNENFANDGMMRAAIEGRSDYFLKDPMQGFVADNIHTHKFIKSHFTFEDPKGITKGFIGSTLLRRRGKEIKIDGIVSLLREVGIEIKGEVNKLPNPTEEEYSDNPENNERFRRAIEKGRDRFLRDLSRGFVAENINGGKFTDAYFTFEDSKGITKGFTGDTLLRRRGKEKKNDDIVSLLREVGIEVKGEVKKVDRLPNPTEEEYADNPENNERFRRAIEKGRDRFLRGPSQGFVAENINGGKFTDAYFTFEDSKGITKGFIGATLLKRRGKEKKIEGIISLLREVGIEVEGKVNKLPNPTEEEYTNNPENNARFRGAIEKGRDQFLKDPSQKLIADNIYVNKFYKASFTFEDPQGITKGFIGDTLLKRRRKEIKIDDIVSLLREVGIEVEGEVNKLPNPTEEEYSDNPENNARFRGAIEKGRDRFLKDPSQGLLANNIHVNKFTKTPFAFEDPQGITKGFVGHTLLSRRGKEIKIEGILSLLRGLGIEFHETLAEGLIEKYNLHDEVTKLGDDPSLLFRYLLLTHSHLTEEAIREITQTSFKGMKENNRIATEELHSLYKVTEGNLAKLQYPITTEESYVEISGKVSGNFEFVQILGDGTKKIAIKPDGSFSGKVRLRIGEPNTLLIYGINLGKKIKTAPTTLQIKQTGVREDSGKILIELISKVKGLEAKLMADPHRLAYLSKTFERELIRTFMSEGIEAGFAALKEKIKVCASTLFQNLYRQIEKKFHEVESLSIPGLRPDQKLYFFQKYCVYEIMKSMEDTGRVPAVILANEQGLGKTLVILATLALMERKGLIIAPNAVVTTWGEQHSRFFTDDPMKIVLGDAATKAEAFRNYTEQTRVTNIEYLRSDGDGRFDFMNQPGEDQILIFDEAQFLSSTGSQQSAGAKKLKGGFKLLVSATPFSGIRTARPIIEFIEGGKYGNSQAFGQVFKLNNPDSVRLLHLVVDRYLLRFRKRDVFKFYDPEQPLESQSNRLPAKIFIDPKDIGSYTLTEAQAEAALDVFLKWEEWQERIKGKALTYEDELTIARSKNFFSRRESLRQLMNDPKYAGVSEEESPKHKKMDEIIDLELEKKNGKIIIFCRYRAEVAEYARRYATYGAMTYYGGTSEIEGKKQDWLKDNKGKVRTFLMKNENEFAIGPGGKLIEDKNGSPIDPLDYSRLMFQNDPNTRVLISTYDSGAVGVTLTAADAVVFSDMARDYVIQYQAEDRANRIDNDRKKYEVRYYTLIAKYPESFLEKAKELIVVKDADGNIDILKEKQITDEMKADEGLKFENLYDNYLAHGTYDEVHRLNIEAQKRIFELIIDGIHSEGEQSDIVKSRMFEKMPFLFQNGQKPEAAAKEEEKTSTEIEEELLGSRRR